MTKEATEKVKSTLDCIKSRCQNIHQLDKQIIELEEDGKYKSDLWYSLDEECEGMVQDVTIWCEILKKLGYGNSEAVEYLNNYEYDY